MTDTELKEETTENNRRFAELAGVPWHIAVVNSFGTHKCSCGKCYLTKGQLIAHIKRNNPDFAAAPWLVLEAMVKREDWPEFYREIGCHRMKPCGLPPRLILDRTGKFRDKAIEWGKGGRK